jgi:tol-pal system protein YbgF
MKKSFLLAFALILPVAAIAAENNSGANLAQMSAKIMQLEEDNRKLNGRIEELQFDIKQLDEQIQALALKPAAPAPEAPEVSDVPPTNNINALGNKPAESSTPSYVTKVGETNEKYVKKVEPVEDPTEQEFDKAFLNIAKEDYKQAKIDFKDFVTNYPGTELSGEAYFWLGEIAWSDKDYNSSAINYLKGYKEAPTGGKAADNIFKLAMSLKELKKKDEACKNLKRFDTEFPEAHPNLKAQAEDELQKLKCK